MHSFASFACVAFWTNVTPAQAICLAVWLRRCLVPWVLGRSSSGNASASTHMATLSPDGIHYIERQLIIMPSPFKQSKLSTSDKIGEAVV